MKNHSNYHWFYLVIIAFTTVIFSSCKKEFLAKKPVMENLIPSTLSDFEGLLNDAYLINTTSSFPLFCGDEYEYLTTPIWQAREEVVRTSYNWSYTSFQTSSDWNNAYKIVLTANTIIKALDNYDQKPSDLSRFGDVKGQAFFLRAYTFFQLAQVFALAYDPATAAVTPGLPLPLAVDANKALSRSTVAETYIQILSDLEVAKSSFSSDLNPKLTSGSRVATLALLARVHLAMGNYEQAMISAQQGLKIKSTLLDYNSLNQNSNTPFDGGNPEVLYQTNHGDQAICYDYYAVNFPNSYSFKTRVNPKLISIYQTNDLRLKLYFFTRNSTDQNRYIKTLYQNIALGYLNFSGLATDEVYLILAECLARNKQTDQALDILRQLAAKRFPVGLVPTITASTPQEALELVLLERRRELVYRGSRWFDVRRLNVAGANITLTRDIDGITFTLPPKDSRFALPIPLDEIGRSGIEQN